MTARYHLGCPIWGRKDWVGHLYSAGTASNGYLSQYAEVFDTVEGNTTFYSVPSPETVDRWCAATPTTFRFSFKLPRSITHERRLARDADQLALAFLDRLAPLGPRRGPFMVQLPPSFGPARLSTFDAFLGAMPKTARFAAELRHPAFYDGGPYHRDVDAVLADHGCERVTMDTRPLREGPDGEGVAEARRKKPDLPTTPLAPGATPIVRFISHPDAEVTAPWLDRWADTIAKWMAEGRRPYFFVHCPNDFHAPFVAREFHQRLQRRCALPPMPDWPGEKPPTGQLGLF